MRRTKTVLLSWISVVIGLLPLCAAPPQEIREPIGNYTNGAARFESFRVTSHLISTQQFRMPPQLATNAAFATNPIISRLRTNTFTYTNLVFDGFVPGSLPHLAWTNFLAHTNGRDLRIWVERTHPADFPTNPPTARWNTNSVIWGMKGLTALSPSWAGQGSPGQIALTALTRRHVYARGHGMGADGFTTNWGVKKVWFLTRDNKLIEAKTKRAVVRVTPGTNNVHRDYTIFLLDRDLPNTIEPMAVASLEDVRKFYLPPIHPPFPVQGVVPYPLFQTEQGGYVNTSVPPLTVNTWKGGDSGSPNMIPLPGELIFYGGRSTSGPTLEMQADMDELCRQEGLNPTKYQMRWVDLEKLSKH